MVWVDFVTRFSESGGECRLTIKREEAYMDSFGLRSSSLIEFMAQAHAFISICENRKFPDRVAPKRTFLAAIRDASFVAEEELKLIPVGSELKIQTSGCRHIGPITLFSGQVLTEDNRVLASASFKVFVE